MKYVITNGLGKYIRHDKSSNRYVEVTGRRYATAWTNPQKAINIRNSLVSALRKSYSLYQEEEQPDACDVPRDDVQTLPPSDDGAPAARIVVTGRAANLKCSDDDISRWFDGIDVFLDFLKDSSSKKEMLSNRLSLADREISDIYHYIEFNDRLNAYQGWLAYKQLQGVLKKRRKIKRELEVISKLCDPIVQGTFDGLRLSNEMKYEPRVLNDLFDEGVIVGEA